MFKKLVISFFAFTLAFLPVAPAIAVDTLWGYYASQGQALPSIADRAVTAATVGLFEYSGTVDQNTELLYRLENPPPALFPQEEGALGFSAVTGYQKTLRASMDSTQSYIPASSLLLSDGTTIDIDDLDGEVYLTLEPGKPRQEIVRCTGITTSTANFTSCTRGLAFKGTSVTSVPANRFSHNAGATIVISNVHYTFKNLIDGATSNNQTIAGKVEFTTSTIWIGDDTTSINKTVYANNGDTNLPFVRYNEGISQWQFSDDGVNTVNLATSTGSGLAASSTAGIGITNSEIYVKASSTLGYTFDSSGNLYRAVSSTTGIEADSNGLSLNTSTISNLISTSTPTVDAVVRAQANSKIADGWVGATTAGDTVYSDGTDLQRLAIGTAGQVLTSSGTAPQWSTVSYSGRIYTDTTTKTFTNSSAENTILTTTITGGTLSTANILRGRVYWNTLNSNSSAATLEVKLKYGATTVATATLAATIPSNTMKGFIDVEILASGATNTQLGSIKIFGSEDTFSISGITNDALYVIGTGTAAEDSTANKTFTITVQISNANADFQSVYGYVEVVR